MKNPFSKPQQEQNGKNLPAVQRPANRISTQGGTYSLAVTVIVLAILIVVNVLVSSLPAHLTRFDISASKLYSITSNTKVVVNNLQQDVTIYWIVQSGQEDDVIETLLDKYDSLSDHISVVKRNPDVYPNFAAEYTDEDVANNSLVVESGDRSRYIAYDDIYVSESSAYSYSYSTSFDGEGAITSAIDYVTTEDLPKMYLLEGHGETDLPTSFADQLTKDNVETESLSLLNIDSIPEDADALMIYAPTSDISEEEKTMLADYTANGGKLLVMAGPTQDVEMTNLNSLLEDYDITVSDGIVVDNDRDHYAFSAPYVLMPDIAETDMTSSLLDASYKVIMPISGGLNVGSSASGVTTLLSTSDSAFSKIAGFDLSTYDKEDGDIDGPFALAVQIDTGNDGQIIWFASSYFLQDMYNAYSSGANNDLAANAVSALIGEREAMSIRSKSLNYNYLTISASTSSLLQVLMIGVFPLAYLAIGIVIVVIRRQKQNAAC